MMNSKSKCYKRLEKLRHLEKIADGRCMLCNFDDNAIDDAYVGIEESFCGNMKFHEKSGIRLHLFCLLFSKGITVQNADETVGIDGFSINNICTEILKAQSKICSFCGSKGATLECNFVGCGKKYHVPCGRRQGSLFLFFADYQTFCKEHLPKNRPTPLNCRRIGRFTGEGRVKCTFCYNHVPTRSSPSSVVYGGCCKFSYFHWKCVQNQAINAGSYHFKCPNCNSEETYRKSVLKAGVYIPTRDAAWELNGSEQYQDLYERRNECSAEFCCCPNGRSYYVEKSGAKYKLLFCKDCGYEASHAGCAKQEEMYNGGWLCKDCNESRRKGNRRPLMRVTTANTSDMVMLRSSVVRTPKVVVSSVFSSLSSDTHHSADIVNDSVAQVVNKRESPADFDVKENKKLKLEKSDDANMNETKLKYRNKFSSQYQSHAFLIEKTVNQLLLGFRKDFENIGSSTIISPKMEPSYLPVRYNRPVFAYTCLPVEEQTDVRRLASLLTDARVANEIDDSVTHLIVPRSLCGRTMKYFTALALGKWIVTSEWVDKCLQCKSLVPEEPYEASGSHLSPESGAPRASRLRRLNKEPPLFAGANVHLRNFGDDDKHGFSKLLQYAGTKLFPVAPKSDDDLSEEHNTVLHHAPPSSIFANTNFFVVYNYYSLTRGEKIHSMNTRRIRTVPLRWMLNCLDKYEIADVDKNAREERTNNAPPVDGTSSVIIF